MTDNRLRAAHDLLAQHAAEEGDTALQTALHKYAVEKKWEEPTATEIAAAIHI
ncbi:hypothetical protein [Microbacterium soli]|uniref:Uncharacterized protein n=1 Tax=Microbacterium soli TaxID=446075 RepID=A0ABP7NB91_9MICO